MTNPTAAPSPQQAVAPCFDRRWSLARDGFGLQRDDENGNYVHIDDAIDVLHAALAPQAVSEPPAGVAVKVDEALRRMYALRDEVWKSARGSEDVDVGGVMSACREAIEALATPTHQAAEPTQAQVSATPGGEWMPIETAPKDDFNGYLILATTAWVCEGYWNADDGCWWERNNDSTDSWGAPMYPTHWQHLPALPGAATPSARGGDARDAARLDYLQRSGATVEIVDFSNKGREWKFRIGGFQNTVNSNIRTAIDAAIAASAQGEAMP